MKAKRRSPVTGPLLTFALMVGSIVAVGAIAHVVDSAGTPSVFGGAALLAAVLAAAFAPALQRHRQTAMQH